MSKLFYTCFLAVASVYELFQIVGNPGEIVSLVYLICFIYVVVKFISGTLPKWVWHDGLSYVGISALLFIILSAFGLPTKVLTVLDSTFCLSIWLRSIRYMSKS
jgi:hypothetical protein